MAENNFCVRDHMDLLAGYVDRKRITVKGGELKSGNGRPLNIVQTFQDFLPQADQRIPLPSMSQFQEMLEDICQERLDDQYRERGDTKYPTVRSSMEFVEMALQKCGAQEIGITGKYVDANGKPFTYSDMELVTLSTLVEYKEERRGQKIPFSRDDLKIMLQKYLKDRKDVGGQLLRELLPYRPENEEGGRECLRWIFADMLQIEGDLDLAVEVMRHWLWQVKRYVYGLPVGEPLMVNILGSQGSGKTQFVRMLTACRGLFKDYHLSATLDQIMDDRNAERWSSYYVAFFDELAVSGTLQDKSLGRVVAQLKKLLTEDAISYREMRTTIIHSAPRTFSAISTSNVPLVNIIRDDTGMRRFFEIVAARKDFDHELHHYFLGEKNQELGDQPETAMDPLLVWTSVDEKRDDGYLIGETRRKVKEIQATYRRKESIDWALENGLTSGIPALVKLDDEEYGVHIQWMNHAERTVYECKEYLGNLPGRPLTLMTSVSVEKAFRSWIEENEGRGRGDYLPRRDNFAMAMQSKGFALLQKKSKYIFVVLVDPKNEEDMEDDSPL